MVSTAIWLVNAPLMSAFRSLHCAILNLRLCPPAAAAKNPLDSPILRSGNVRARNRRYGLYTVASLWQAVEARFVLSGSAMEILVVCYEQVSWLPLWI